MKRLDTVARWLADLLRSAPASNLRRAIVVALEFAIDKSSFTDPLIEDGIECVRTGRNDEAIRSQLLALGEQLDAEYFARAGDAKSGLIDEQDYLSAFARARAVAAIAAGLGPHLLEAAFESIYEAAAATEDPNQLFCAVRDALK
ncbi:MAG: hypothetical protein IPK87_15820 [Planctomycetes bacterium]|nr:hypothetical protein [Planctomycetota bacterium]